MWVQQKLNPKPPDPIQQKIFAFFPIFLCVILAPLGINEKRQTFNINADTAAGAIAKELKARRLLIISDVEGVLDNNKKLITEINSKKAKEYRLNRLSLGTNGRKRNPEMKKGFDHGNTIGSAIKKVRYFGDLPANFCTPSFLVKEARKIASKHKTVSLKVVNEPEMKKLGMGALLSVTAGSVEPSRLIILKYQGGKSNQKPIVIVGKGVTFDSGGISIKPGHKMDEMKFDMCGGSAAIGILQAVADIGLPLNVISIIPACENLPSGIATKPER